MATKREGVPCYDKAAEDEPLFVLRGQDQFAAETVEYWAHLASGGQPRVLRHSTPAAHPQGARGVSRRRDPASMAGEEDS